MLGRAVEQRAPQEFLVEERLQGLDVVGYLAEEWAHWHVVFYHAGHYCVEATHLWG
jgi:hypothetical protein